MTLNELAKKLHAFQNIDGCGFRRRARILQSIWRDEQGYEMGKNGGEGLGSRLPMPWAQDTLGNYLTDAIRDVVVAEVLSPQRDPEKLYAKPRIFNDLLSSQPLAFNLFGELQHDLDLGSRLIEGMTDGRFRRLVKVDFEHSPKRRNPKYTGDRTAFDVFLICEGANQSRAFIGIEVKYHENLAGKAEERDQRSNHHNHYDEITDAMGCFAAESGAELKKAPSRQIWRDHLLAGSLLQAHDYDDGIFVFLYPKDNLHCLSAIDKYRSCLMDEKTLAVRTLESVVAQLRRHSDAAWINSFYDRYLDFSKIDSRLTAGRDS